MGPHAKMLPSSSEEKFNCLVHKHVFMNLYPDLVHELQVFSVERIDGEEASDSKAFRS